MLFPPFDMHISSRSFYFSRCWDNEDRQGIVAFSKRFTQILKTPLTPAAPCSSNKCFIFTIINGFLKRLHAVAHSPPFWLAILVFDLCRRHVDHRNEVEKRRAVPGCTISLWANEATPSGNFTKHYIASVQENIQIPAFYSGQKWLACAWYILTWAAQQT